MNEKPRCIYRAGDLVSLERWDKSERKETRLGSPGIVQSVAKGRCQSGWLVTVKCDNGQTRILDQDWLAPYLQKDLFEI